MCKIWNEVLFHMHTHTKLALWEDVIVFMLSQSFLKCLSKVVQRSTSRHISASVIYLFTARCSLYVPNAHNHLVVLLTFSHFSIISVFWLTEAPLILSEVGSQYFYLGWVLLWPRWLLRVSPLVFCLDEFEICFELLFLKIDYDQDFAQYFNSDW